MTIDIVPKTATTQANSTSYEVSATAYNAGFQKLTQSAAGILGAGSATDTSVLTPTAAQVLLGNATPAPTWTTVTGDVTIGATGVTAIGAGKVTEAMQVLANNTTGNVSITKHGYAPILPNDATKYLDGTGAYSVPAGGAAASYIVGDIEGLELVYTSSGVLTVKAGYLDINGTVRTLAADTTFTSGTNKALDNSTVITFAASKNYFVYAYWNGSALVLALEDSAGSNAAVYDSTLRYWKATTVGANARCIGFIWGSGAGTMFAFHMVSLGRHREIQLDSIGSSGALTLVNGATQATSSTWTSLTLTPYITSMCQQWLTFMSSGNSSGGSTSVWLSQDGGTTTTERMSSNVAAGGFANAPVLREPNPSGSWTWSVQSSTNTFTLRLAGATFRV